jgi:hypothetical protein
MSSAHGGRALLAWMGLVLMRWLELWRPMRLALANGGFFLLSGAGAGFDPGRLRAAGRCGGSWTGWGLVAGTGFEPVTFRL